MTITIQNQNPSVRIPVKGLRASLRKIIASLGVDDQEVNFLFVSDAAIRRYNAKYLRHDYATDVIAFEMKERGVLGDVLISADTARRQAREQGHATRTEMIILAIHGLLHLLGYRDKKKKDRDRMWRKTNELLALAEKAARKAGKARTD